MALQVFQVALTCLLSANTMQATSRFQVSGTNSDASSKKILGLVQALWIGGIARSSPEGDRGSNSSKPWSAPRSAACTPARRRVRSVGDSGQALSHAEIRRICSAHQVPSAHTHGLIRGSFAVQIRAARMPDICSGDILRGGRTKRQDSSTDLELFQQCLAGI